jgi:hypothetical protein
MGTRKHNEFLETGASDDEISSQGYDSEAEDIRKGVRNGGKLKSMVVMIRSCRIRKQSKTR